jgi:hypothetical protein
MRPLLQETIRGAALLLALVVCALSPANSVEQRFVTIGTGGVNAVYYPTGGAICRLVNEARKTHGIRCYVEATKGSVFNVKNIRDRELDFAVVQSDVQYYAYNGRTENFRQDGPYKDLRSIFSIHSEPVTLVARQDSGIRHIRDVKGKRHNIGNPGSGTRGTWNVVERALGWRRGDLRPATEWTSSEQSQALCDNKIDSYFWLVGHPSANTEEATANCPAVIAEVSGPEIDRLIKNHPYYRYATVPGGVYRGNPSDIRSFGVAATFVTRADMPEDVVYEMVMAVLKEENFENFKSQHPAFSRLTREEMVQEGLTAPLHPGAERAFKELGLLD